MAFQIHLNRTKPFFSYILNNIKWTINFNEIFTGSKVSSFKYRRFILIKTWLCKCWNFNWDVCSQKWLHLGKRCEIYLKMEISLSGLIHKILFWRYETWLFQKRGIPVKAWIDIASQKRFRISFPAINGLNWRTSYLN